MILNAGQRRKEVTSIDFALFSPYWNKEKVMIEKNLP